MSESTKVIDECRIKPGLGVLSAWNQSDGISYETSVYLSFFLHMTFSKEHQTSLSADYKGMF